MRPLVVPYALTHGLPHRKLIGPTHIRRSRTEAPQSIRGRFAKSDTWNCAHGSGTHSHNRNAMYLHYTDSVDTALREIGLFFPKLSIEPPRKEPAKP